MRIMLSFLAACALAAGPALAQQTTARGAGQASSLTVPMIDRNGNSVGTVQIRDVAHGVILVANLTNLPPGTRGFHIHERGVCDPPDFASAGDHYNPADTEHGFDHPQGYHAGDLPNIHVTPQGTALVEFHAPRLTLAPRPGAAGGQGPFPLLDQDGTAIIIHASADDYRDADSAGDRIACGVVRAP